MAERALLVIAFLVCVMQPRCCHHVANTNTDTEDQHGRRDYDSDQTENTRTGDSGHVQGLHLRSDGHRHLGTASGAVHLPRVPPLRLPTKIACKAKIVAGQQRAHRVGVSSVRLGLPGLPAARTSLVDVRRTSRARALGDCFPALIARESLRAGIGAHVLSALIWRESRCDPLAVGRMGELGLGQIKPGTRAARGYGREALLRPGQNLRATVRHLRWCLDLCGDLAGALGVYSGRRTCRAGRESAYSRAVLDLAATRADNRHQWTDNFAPSEVRDRENASR